MEPAVFSITSLRGCRWCCWAFPRAAAAVDAEFLLLLLLLLLPLLLVLLLCLIIALLLLLLLVQLGSRLFGHLLLLLTSKGIRQSSDWRVTIGCSWLVESGSWRSPGIYCGGGEYSRAQGASGHEIYLGQLLGFDTQHAAAKDLHRWVHARQAKLACKVSIWMWAQEGLCLGLAPVTDSRWLSLHVSSGLEPGVLRSPRQGQVIGMMQHCWRHKELLGDCWDEGWCRSSQGPMVLWYYVHVFPPVTPPSFLRVWTGP